MGVVGRSWVEGMGEAEVEKGAGEGEAPVGLEGVEGLEGAEREGRVRAVVVAGRVGEGRSTEREVEYCRRTCRRRRWRCSRSQSRG